MHIKQDSYIPDKFLTPNNHSQMTDKARKERRERKEVNLIKKK